MGARIEERYNANPGPGQYDADASKIRSDVAGSVRIGQAERQDHWVEISKTELPGPGNYSDQTNTFGKAMQGGYMGSKLKTQVNANPGPGQYEYEDKAIKQSAQLGIINQSERQELWMEESTSEFPGPGNYAEAKSTFGQTNHAPTMGARIEERFNSNPGPGQYETKVSQIANSVRIGQAKRKALWAEQEQSDQPGPGNYAEQKSTFGQTHNAPTMGAKIEEKISMNPGPG